MGYRTYYSLRVPPGKEELISILRKENEEAEFAFDDDGFCTCETKWYNFIDDMRNFSVKYPDVLFTLLGEGEEQGDLWHCYFMNGKCQECPVILTYDEFDPNKLN